MINYINRRICFLAIGCLTMSLMCLGGCAKKDAGKFENISTGILRKEVFALVSSAENSSLDYDAQYAYIEDIGDGRGYTAGVIGFTSGTGDLLKVIEVYGRLKPQNNALEQYIPALEAVNGTDSHEGLDDAFLSGWTTAAADSEMIQAQNAVLDEMYLTPAIEFADEDGLSILGQYIYYDALVVHGPGDDEDSFNGIRTTAKTLADPPSVGGRERTYLLSFLEARSAVMKKEEAHSDLSRIEAQKKFLEEGNYTLALPLSWTMYGKAFTLNRSDLTDME